MMYLSVPRSGAVSLLMLKLLLNATTEVLGYDGRVLYARANSVLGMTLRVNHNSKVWNDRRTFTKHQTPPSWCRNM